MTSQKSFVQARKELILQIKRDGETLDIKVTPESSKTKNLFGEEVQTFMIGIQPSDDVTVEKVNPVIAVGMGFVQTWGATKLTVVSIWKLIQRVIPAKTIGGPIMIAQLAGEQAKRGILSLAIFMAILSINLGVINLFPIPILDGGHFIFLVLEAILRKPVSIKKMEIAQQFGLILIVLLMISLYNDILRTVSRRLQILRRPGEWFGFISFGNRNGYW
jgi:regulator of sigma E protease